MASVQAYEGEEKVSFTNKRKEKLVGILKSSDSPKTVILCHGLASHKNGFHLPAIAKALAEAGLSSLRIDLSGNGESEGKFGYANIKDEADDIQGAAEYLGGVRREAYGVLGHSKAGSGVLVNAATYGQILKVVNCSGRFDHKRGLQARFGEDVFERVENKGGIPLKWNTEYGEVNWVFDAKDLNDRMTIDMAEVCSKIGDKVDILTIHGRDDETIPVEDAEQFAKLLNGNKLIIIEGADHNYRKQDTYIDLIREVTNFFTESTSKI